MQPKNVQAILDWYKEKRPDVFPYIERVFSSDDAASIGFQGLMLQSFEAGRVFQHEHPEVQSGAGYLD